MADTIVTVNIHAKTANTDNGWVPAPVAKQSPVLNYDADLNTTLSLLNFPNVFIYDAGTGQIINKNNLQTYYPEYNPGGGGGGGTTNYTDLTNKPKINNVTLQGNKSLSDIGATSVDEVYKKSEVDTALDNKVTKESGKGLSTNDFTNDDLTKLSGIESNAEANVQSDWNQTDTNSDDFIKNKPTLATVATSGDYNDLGNKPTIPDAQVNSDWNAASGVAQILNKPTLGTAAAADTTTSITSGGTGLPTSGTVYTDQQRQDGEIGLLNQYAGGKNLLNFEKWASIIDVTDGTKSVSGNSITLTATGNDCKTKWQNVDFPPECRIPVSPGMNVVLSWHTNTTEAGRVFIFPDGLVTGVVEGAAIDGSLNFVVPSGCAYLTFRFGVTYSGKSITYSDIMLCTLADWNTSHAFQPYALDNPALTKRTDILPSLVDRGAKNLLKNTAQTQTVGGVTFTMNPDGSITANGTKTNNDWLYLSTGNSLSSGTYVLSSGLAPQENLNVRTLIATADSLSASIMSAERQNQVATRSFSQSYSNLIYAIRISSGATVDNLVFKPMLCTAEDYAISPEFVPYAMNNHELTEGLETLEQKFISGNISTITSNYTTLFDYINNGMPANTIAQLNQWNLPSNLTDLPEKPTSSSVGVSLTIIKGLGGALYYYEIMLRYTQSSGDGFWEYHGHPNSSNTAITWSQVSFA